MISFFLAIAECLIISEHFLMAIFVNSSLTFSNWMKLKKKLKTNSENSLLVEFFPRSHTVSKSAAVIFSGGLPAIALTKNYL
jgi:hypothetical protein